MKELKLAGGYGSPYSRKMRAVLRYRRIPFRWILRGSAWDVGIPPVPVALIPVLVFPGENGAQDTAAKPDTAMIDSTFQILKLESIFPERSLVPKDPALAFLQSLIEDYGDEWLTKPMFHYRWSYAADIQKSSHVLPLDRDVTLDAEQAGKLARMFADRQIGRLGVVGSNRTTAPVIEASYRRLLAVLDAHLAGGQKFLMGERPGAGDFGLFGQLSQLAHFDPTPSAVAAEHAPRVVSWVSWMDDLSWLDVDDAGWISRDAIGDDAARVLRRDWPGLRAIPDRECARAGGGRRAGRMRDRRATLDAEPVPVSGQMPQVAARGPRIAQRRRPPLRRRHPRRHRLRSAVRSCCIAKDNLSPFPSPKRRGAISSW